MNFSPKIQIFLSRYFPFSPFILSLIGGLLFFNLTSNILNDFNAKLLHTLILLNICAVLFLKYKKYEFKIRKEEWQELVLFLRNKFPQYDFNNDFYCNEVFDRNDNFKYTELFVKLDSDYRVVVEEFEISKFTSLPEILKLYQRQIS
jgi:hypothetical protein